MFNYQIRIRADDSTATVTKKTREGAKNTIFRMGMRSSLSALNFQFLTALFGGYGMDDGPFVETKGTAVGCHCHPIGLPTLGKLFSSHFLFHPVSKFRDIPLALYKIK